jgi:hypothetical protein
MSSRAHLALRVAALAVIVAAHLIPHGAPAGTTQATTVVASR